MEEQKIVDATPLMRHYFKIKEQYADMLVLFQVGDFYELFFEDAKVAASFLGIALTKRGKYNGDPIPLCGVPVHTVDHYLTKLVRGGFKVALCDQLEEAQAGKMVERGITRVLTPGTLTESQLLDEKSASYLFSFFPLENQWGLLFGELLTAQLFATVLPISGDKQLDAELSRFFPDEILLPRIILATPFQAHFKKTGYVTTLVDVSEDQQSASTQWMAQQFKPETVSRIQSQQALHAALGTFHSYLYKNQRAALEQFKSLHFYSPEDFLMLDAATQRNLELVKNSQDGSRKGTLFNTLDQAATPMGSRMIKKWLMRPLVSRDAIVQRQDAIAYAVQSVAFLQQLEESLKKIGDVERVVGRITLNRGLLHDYLMLMQTLSLIPHLRSLLLAAAQVPLFGMVASLLDNFDALHKLLTDALNDDGTHEWFIKQGYSSELDNMRVLVEHAHIKILELEQQEQQQTGIGSLKIRYNQVHGYYIEVTKTHMDAIPDYYKRQQTLVGRERYTMPALQQLEHEIMTARNTITHKEKEIFENIKRTVGTYASSLRKMAHALSSLDALFGLAKIAYQQRYVRPMLNAERIIQIDHGRHPVVEQHLQRSFIANSTHLTDDESLLIITGPNMGGKSTYLRQVALICILTHVGSFVPAKAANVALLDRIFSRIGAGDNLAEGKSTFLVEMEETATICLQATERSLVILDEVGRGTSTFDGLAIAQAVVEYMHTTVRARCLFATHYHELALLQEKFLGIASYYAASKKTPNGIIFLYTMQKGFANGSFGIEVAKLAQLPKRIINRSQEILDELVENGDKPKNSTMIVATNNSNNSDMRYDALFNEYQQLTEQYHLLQQKMSHATAVMQQLTSIDYEQLSPKAAFDLLWQLKEQQ